MSNDPALEAAKKNHPIALYFIFWGEFAERSSYYGMRAILFLFMTKELMFSKADANSYIFMFKMACYLLPLLGGYLADRWLGKYWTIVGFSIPYVFGQVLLAFSDQFFVFFALFLLACGSGVTKPNISALLGQTYDQRRPGDLGLRAKAFLWFYFSINVGALLSQFFLPIVRDKYGYQVAFLIPAVLMFGALIAFALGKPFYARETPGPAPELTPEQKAERWKLLKPLFGVFALIVLFWIPYEHNDTQWVDFAGEHMDLNTPWLASLGGPARMSADAFQWANAMMVIILLPFFQWFYGRFDPKNRISPITKMFYGFLFTAAGPLVLMLCSMATQRDVVVSAMWLIPAYMLLTVGEVLVYGTALDFSYGQAPNYMKSMITACFLLTNAVANLINIRWTRVYEGDLSMAWNFWMDEATMLAMKKTPSIPIDATTFFAIDVVLPLIGAALIFHIGRNFHLEHKRLADVEDKRLAEDPK